jgi:molybdopterin-containing oxidoreductase family iron-sulfur binding subunit
MQEFPDAVTKAVWNAWVEMHPETAEPLGVETGDLVQVRTEAGSVTAPAYVYPGIRPDTIAVPLGQGHSAYGRTAAGRGFNALDLLDGTPDERSGALAYAGAAATLTATGRRGQLVIMQGSNTDHDREIAEIVNVADVPNAMEHEIDLTTLVEAAYDSDPMSPYRWGMTIDLNACTGCGACVTACYSENNIPVVGEDLCGQGREMSWLQIMRYYEEAEDGFQTVQFPTLCQQCGDAPCEPVCPVYAAYHTPEGLNGQVYNRCVGTRYCANNCPYKVRRFNWFTSDFPYPMNLQLNPDVTVRSKGVMEKCTFCVQRINRAKLDAKAEGRLVEDGEIQTACMQSCPTQAITFGNLKDPASRVSRKAKGSRGYAMLDELNTRPAVTYLKSVTYAELPEGSHGHGGGHDETTAEEAPEH